MPDIQFSILNLLSFKGKRTHGYEYEVMQSKFKVKYLDNADIYHTAQYFENLLFVHTVLYLNVNHVKYIFLFTIKMIGKLLYTYHASDILKFNENMQKI